MRVVRRGARLLLRLVGSVLSLSHVRTNVLRFARKSVSMGGALSRVRAVTGLGLPSRIDVHLLPNTSCYVVRAIPGQMERMLGGCLSGTLGRARRNFVSVNCRLPRRSEVHFFIHSANYNVPPRGRGSMFRHFIGLGDFGRNANLKLSVYAVVTRGVGKGINIDSVPKGNSRF